MATAALFGPIAPIAAQDMPAFVAHGIALYEKSKDACFYEPVVGDQLAKADQLFVGAYGSNWEEMKRQSALLSGVVSNMSAMMGGATPCQTLGLSVGQALSLSSVYVGPAPGLEEAAARLNGSGGRSIGDVPASSEPMLELNTPSPQPGPSTTNCKITITGRIEVAGACAVEDSETSILVRMLPESTGDGLFFVLQPKDGYAEAYWNGEEREARAHEPLGLLRHEEACWVSSAARLCFDEQSESVVDEAAWAEFDKLEGLWSYPELDEVPHQGCADTDGQYRVAIGRYEAAPGELTFGVGSVRAIGMYDSYCTFDDVRMADNAFTLAASCMNEGEPLNGEARISALSDSLIKVSLPQRDPFVLQACPAN